MGYEFTVYKGGKEGLVKSTTHKDALKDDEVYLQITHSGICGTDRFYRSAEMALGHEGIGIVKEIGPGVKSFKIGDRVGWGFEHDSCGHCHECLTGQETYCAERHIYGSSNLDQGSLASHAVWHESFLFLVPENLKSEEAAPLMCGGATVFNALNAHSVKAYHRVGVLGVGGLGHLAIQFAAKMGCEVVVFSTTDSKKAEALQFGAREFYVVSQLEKTEAIRPIDHLLVTTNTLPNWDIYLPLMAKGGAIYPLTVSLEKLQLPALALNMAGIRVQGSFIAARYLHRKMLEFAAFHDIKPVVQKWPMTVQGIDEAFKRLDENSMRYRGVLVAEG
ncbi:alcohol dehydrogenase-1 [Coleophoma cylindrospora]|uniref:Alcohol dehydrogenase-1 n=1 Tax=Coleophoma cylindrospora TaxID=1849047 RepID=A0A3D8QDN1_9HELO|nr:alcohol dehydrogenase-1 [Coleophoma cylindrospora]